MTDTRADVRKVLAQAVFLAQQTPSLRSESAGWFGTGRQPLLELTARESVPIILAALEAAGLVIVAADRNDWSRDDESVRCPLCSCEFSVLDMHGDQLTTRKEVVEYGPAYVQQSDEGAADSAAQQERIKVLEAFVVAGDVLHDWQVFAGILADDDDGAMRRATLQERKDAYQSARAAVGELEENHDI